LPIVPRTAIVVGLPVALQPPHKSQRAELSHRAFQEYSLPQDVTFNQGIGGWGSPWRSSPGDKQQQQRKERWLTAPFFVIS